MRPIVTFPLSAVIGFGIGFAFFRGPQPLTPTAAAALRAQELSTDAAAWPDSPEATDAKAQRLVAAALRKGNRVERDDEMYCAIETLTAEDFRRLIADAGALKAMAEKLGGIDWQTSRDLASALIGRWLKVEPDGVMKWVPRALDLIPANQNARGWIFDALAKKQPEEFLALAASRKDAGERAEIISRGLRELAARDPAKARAWLAGCTDPADRRVAEKAVALGTVQADPLRAIEVAGTIESRQESLEVLRSAAEKAAKMGPGILRQLATTPMKPWMLGAMVNDVSLRDPELAVDLAIKSSDGGTNYTIGNAFSALARRDLAQSIAKLEGLTGADLSAAVSAIGNTWAGNDPAAGLNWLAGRPVAERRDPNRYSRNGNDALVMAFSDWARSAKNEARAWADALPSGATRDAVQSELARSLAERGEPAEATQVLARLGRAADPKAIADIAGAWARRDPQAAADWAIGQEPGPAQSRALAGIVGTWANDDRDGVENWLAQFPPGEARDLSIKSFLWRGTAWTSGSEERLAEFDQWFDLIDDPYQRGIVARSNFWQRKQRDPAAARAWLSTLPNVDSELIRATLRDNAD